MEDLLQMLRDIDLPKDGRDRVHAGDVEHVKRGMALGTVTDYSAKHLKPSVNTKRYKTLARTLCKLAREEFPDFVFTSIMVNKGGSELHVDKNNCGPSIIFSLGDHTGGDLWQFNPSTWQGDIFEIKYNPTECNGLLPHATLPFEGERYSLVYYCLQSWRQPPKGDDALLLKDLGFWAMSDRPASYQVARHHLIPLARRQLNAFLHQADAKQENDQLNSQPPPRPRLLELFAGTGSVGRAFAAKGWSVVGLDLVPGHAIQCDILDWNYMAYEPDYFDAIHASPPCTQYSIARTNSKTPRDFEGADSLVERTLAIIDYFKPKIFIIENPYTGYMKSRPCMVDMHPYLRTVCYCKYGLPYRKATAIWTNLGDKWVERPMCTNKDPCEHVVNGKHGTRAQVRNGWSTQQLYVLPAALCDDLATATTEACTTTE